MSLTSLSAYFQPQGHSKALDVYSRMSRGRAWSLPDKMRLYRSSRLAFVSTGSQDDRLNAFRAIYGTLTSHWQVFRPHGADECWNAQQVFEVMQREVALFSWDGAVALPGFFGNELHQGAQQCLSMMRGIKPNNGYPTMTVSKFLHFYNPSLFPIYDTEVIWNLVFHRFKSDYRAFCIHARLDPRAQGASFLVNYMAWGNGLVSSAYPGFMTTFVDWLHDELPRRDFECVEPAVLLRLYATAFEFTIIGAAMAIDGEGHN